MKRHFEALGGLRGTAALLVIVSHLFEGVSSTYAANPLLYTHLSTDFFTFELHGAVHLRRALAGAADARFFHLRHLRLVCLHPMVQLAMVIRLAYHWFDPYVDHCLISPRSLIAVVALKALLLPVPPLPSHHGETHSLNGPCWSLF